MEKRYGLTRRDLLKRSVALASIAALNPGLLLSSPSKKRGANPQNLTFYFPDTGHNLEEPFLTFWRTNGGRLIFGDPITEINRNGLPTQYFQKARMELHPNNQIMLGLLGSELFGDKNLPPPEDKPLHLKLARFYNKRGGSEIFGNPISSTFTEAGKLVQVFQRAKFIYNPNVLGKFYQDMEVKYGVTLLALDEVKLDYLGEDIVYQKGLSTAKADPKPEAIDYSTFDPPKKIVVDQKEQLLTAYEGDVPVIWAEISSGRPSAPTVVGTFSVLAKVLSQNYDWTDEYGNPYFYPSVPYNLLFDYGGGGFFLHAAYWHEDFGKTLNKVLYFGKSRGCVNMGFDDAQELFGWAKIGTQVIIGPHS